MSRILQYVNLKSKSHFDFDQDPCFFRNFDSAWLVRVFRVSRYRFMNNKASRVVVDSFDTITKKRRKRRRTHAALSHFRSRKRELSSWLSVQIEIRQIKVRRSSVWQVLFDLFRGIRSSHVVPLAVFTAAVEHQQWREYAVARTKRKERVKRVVSGLLHTHARMLTLLPSIRVPVSRVRPVPRFSCARPHCTRLRDA